jgi:hypothetical protein
MAGVAGLQYQHRPYDKKMATWPMWEVYQVGQLKIRKLPKRIQ